MGVSVAALSFENEDYRRLIAGALGIGMQFGVLLPFSRKQELEADMVGLKYMAKAGYDPNEAAMFWNRMAKQAGSRPPEFMSTHPDPANRAKTLEIEVRKVASLYAESDKKVSRRIDL
jgi:predicted Zn-dependent protease